MNIGKQIYQGLSLVTLTAALMACGGGSDSGNIVGNTASAPKIFLLKGGSCTGSCTGGGGTPVSGANPLPTSAPAPDVWMHESFGPGPQGVRPKSGKGELRSTFIGTTLGGFWVEWPGNKDNAWITPAGEATWKFAQSSGAANPYALPSPLEPFDSATSNGVVWADITDGATGGFPTALLPVTWPGTAWSMSFETFPSQSTTSYVALGVTNSGATLANLATVGTVSLQLRNVPEGTFLVWELWKGGAPRQLLAYGTTQDMGYNQLKLSYNPQTQQLTPSVNGADGASVAINLGAPRYAAIEGNGVADNFVLRKVSQ